MATQRPGERYWSFVKPLWDNISIYDGRDKFLRLFSAAPTTAAHLFAGRWCQSEVRNGGLDQFFWNSTGVLAPKALSAHRAMELTNWADVPAQAMEFFGRPYPRDRTARQAKLTIGDSRARGVRFQALDERFHEWLHAEPNRWDRAADRFAQSNDA